MFSRRKIAALVAEFLGTGILAFVVLTVSRSQIGIPYFVAIAAGLAVAAFALALDRDVQFNPAYTLGLWTARRIKTLKALLFIVAQVLGGMAAYALYKYFAENGVVQPLPTEHKGTILVAEAFGAFVFAFGATGALIRHADRPVVRAVITGAMYTLGVMVASVAAAGFINPAVAVASNALAWTTYVLGPVLGAVIGVNLYTLLFAGRERSAFRVAKANVVKKDKNDKEEKAEKSEKAEKAKEKLNDDAIEVSPANVDDKPLSKVEKAEKSAKSDKKSKNKKKK